MSRGKPHTPHIHTQQVCGCGWVDVVPFGGQGNVMWNGCMTNPGVWMWVCEKGMWGANRHLETWVTGPVSPRQPEGYAKPYPL